MRILNVLAALLVLCSVSGHAATLADVTLPDTYEAGGRTLVLNGAGLRTLTIFNVRIYVAGLYLAKPSHDAQEILASTTPKVMLLHFLHSGSKEEVEKEYRLGEKNNCGDGGCAPADAPDFEKLVEAAPAVKPGDTSTYIFANGGVEVLANGRQIAKIANPDLAFRLLAGFIGNRPPSAELKQGLLGLGQ